MSRTVAGMLAMLGFVLVMVGLGPITASAIAGDEFINPSDSSLPALNAYNVTPTCPVSVSEPVCAWSPEPAPDPDNPENPALVPGSTALYYENCAYWVAEKRPDIEIYAASVYGFGDLPSGGWDYLPDATKAGYPISNVPAVGDVAVWMPNQAIALADGATTFTGSSGGHVSYVESVGSDGTVTLSETGSNGAGDTILVAGSTADQLHYIGFGRPNAPAPTRTSAPIPTPTPTSTLPSTPTQPTSRPAPAQPSGTARPMHQRLGPITVARSGHISVDAYVNAHSGSLTARASGRHGTRRLTVHRRSSSELIIGSQLPAGRWRLEFTWTPAAGYTRPPTAWRTIVVR